MTFKIHPQRIETSNGYTAWAIFDEDIKVWEICSQEDGSGYFGCANTLHQAKKFAEKWFK